MSEVSLVNITNDAWYGRTAAPYHHLNMVVFRAVENNAYLVRAANTGISAVVDPTGRVIAASNLFEERILVQTIRTRSADTFYTRHGDVFAWLSLLGAMAIILVRIWNTRREPLGQMSGRARVSTADRAGPTSCSPGGTRSHSCYWPGAAESWSS